MRVKIGTSTDFPESTLISVTGDGINILAVRINGSVYAVHALCPHLNLSLRNGTLEGHVITCPWHGSKFDIRTGKNLDWVQGIGGFKMPGWSRALIALGREPTPLTTYPVSEENGQVFVELPKRLG